MHGMTRRKFGEAGVSVGVAFMAAAAFGQDKTTGRKAESGSKLHAEHDKVLRDCAKACSDCQRECDMCATHCAHLLLESKKEHATTLMTCQDCADICVAAAQIVSRGGPFATVVCESCAEACLRCGKECEKFPNDEHMKSCADECRKCEKACREMAKHAGHAAHEKTK